MIIHSIKYIMSSKFIGIVPINYNHIINPYKSDFDTANITRIFCSNENNLFTIKKKKEHKDVTKIIIAFNKQFNSSLNSDNTKIIEFGWINNICIYLFIVSDYELISINSLNSLLNDKENFGWKVLLDRFRENEEQTDVYTNILSNNGMFDNVTFDVSLNFLNIKNTCITIREIYNKLINLYII